VVVLLAPGEFVAEFLDVFCRTSRHSLFALARIRPNLTNPNHAGGEVRRESGDGSDRPFHRRLHVVAGLVVRLDAVSQELVVAVAGGLVARFRKVDIGLDAWCCRVLVYSHEGIVVWCVERRQFAFGLPIVVESAVIRVRVGETSRVDEHVVCYCLRGNCVVDAAFPVATGRSVVAVAVDTVGVVLCDEVGEDVLGRSGANQ
jgi:hypothetical protein